MPTLRKNHSSGRLSLVGFGSHSIAVPIFRFRLLRIIIANTLNNLINSSFTHWLTRIVMTGENVFPAPCNLVQLDKNGFNLI